MQSRVVSFPLSLGRKDSIDPKLAPLGVLGVCKNLRVLKDGRLGSRKGYQPLTMNFSGTAGIAYDLHEYNGRLAALFSSYSDGYPTQIAEYSGISSNSQQWINPDPGHELTPFWGLKDIDSLPPPSSGVDEIDSAAGAGYVCVVTRSIDGTVFACVVRESDRLMIVSQNLTSGRLSAHARVTFSVDSFYIGSQRADNSIDIFSFKPGTDNSWQTLKSGAYAASGTAAVFDIVAVDNPSSTLSTGARVCLAVDHSTATDLIIRVFTGVGLQTGSDIALAGTDTTCISLSADQTANKIYLGICVSGGASSVYQYNFAGTLLLGPTGLSSGTHVAVARMPASAASASVATVATITSSTSTGNTVIRILSESAHLVKTNGTIFSAVGTTRVLRWTPSTATNDSQDYAIIFGGYVAPVATSTTDATNALFFWTASIGGATQGWAHMATRDFTRATPRTRVNLGLHLDTTNNRICWCALRDSGSGTAQAAITTFDNHPTARRQGVTFGGLRYIAGAPMQVWDGRCLTEAFQEVPGIVSATPSNGAGSLTNSATYTYVVHWEVTLADGSLWLSAPSSPKAVTMGASDDTVTLVVSTPHHSAIASAGSTLAPQITAVISRTVFASSIEGSVFRRSTTAKVPVNLSNYGATLSITDLTDDTTLSVATELYTQGQRGNLSGCLEHDAPRTSQYIAASESRLYAAGQLRRNQFQASKEAFIEEPFTFSEFSVFFGQVNADIVGLYSLDRARILFTRDDIFAVFGAGPDDIGGGQLESPIRIPTPTGLEDWRSLLEDPKGLYCQLDDAKLYQLPRGGGTPEWVGIDVQDTLSSYPVITGACKSRREDVALFACQNAATGTDARILARSLRTGIWTEDTPPLTSSKGIEAFTNYGDTVAYLSGGVVFVQSATSYADNTSTVIPVVWRTNPLYPFTPTGNGLIYDALAFGEYRSAGTLALRVSYDDGVSFTSLASFSLSGLTVGQTIVRRWALPTVGARSIILEWTYTPTSAGQGLILNAGALLIGGEPGLPELLPAEAA